MLRSLGIKVKPFDAQKEAMLRQFDKSRRVKEWKRKAWGLSKDLSRKKISPEVYRRETAEVQAAILAILRGEE